MKENMKTSIDPKENNDFLHREYISLCQSYSQNQRNQLLIKSWAITLTAGGIAFIYSTELSCLESIIIALSILCFIVVFLSIHNSIEYFIDQYADNIKILEDLFANETNQVAPFQIRSHAHAFHEDDKAKHQSLFSRINAMDAGFYWFMGIGATIALGIKLFQHCSIV